MWFRADSSSAALPRVGHRAIWLLAALSACTASIEDKGPRGTPEGGATSMSSGGALTLGGGVSTALGGAMSTSGGAPDAPGGAPAVTNPGSFGDCPAGDAEPGVTPLMKLSTLQYKNTVRDLLTASGLNDVAAELSSVLAGVPDDSTVAFRGLDQRISADHIAAYFKVAVAVGDAATKTSARLTALAGSCATTSPLSATCLDGFLNGFARRALRRALSSEELAEFKDVAQGSSPKAATGAEALRNVIVTLLMSPRFVNHLEVDGTAIAGRDDYIALVRRRFAAFVHVLADPARRRLARRRGRRNASDRRGLPKAAEARVR